MWRTSGKCASSAAPASSAPSTISTLWPRIRSHEPLVEDAVTDPRSEEAREQFTYFSNEYAQALQAFQTIEEQSATLLLLGVADDLRQFVDQFLEMATKTRKLAVEKGETNFAEWFDELIGKAEALRGEIVRR
jgi:hypothetical protein